ncbi:sulfite exporter TauE/SafE family protein [Selenomonadales bacterium OttesenSCG-928-I06]|nr:sulfite exporter TauE/SafE family protein [Selenomonadales bacterium OttesenSCG-928-I06]
MYFVLGLGVGTFGTLVGIGGGLILIPVFVLLLNFTPQNAVGTSLMVVFFNAISGSYAYIKQKKVFYDAGIRFALATIPGAFLGSYMAQYFTVSSFNLSFGILLIALALVMLIKPSSKAAIDFNKDTFTYNKTIGVVASAFVGFISSIMGIGGGIIHVPMMILVLGFPTHVATATSQFVLAISSGVGVASHFSLGNVLAVPAISIGLGAVVGAQIGARLARKTKSKVIITLLSVALFALGIRFIAGSF